MSQPGTDHDLRQMYEALSAQVNNLSASVVQIEQRPTTDNPSDQDSGLGNGDEIGTDDQALRESLKSGYENAARSERLLHDAGYADATNVQPTLIDLTREARKAAMRMCATGVTGEYEDEDGDVIEDRGKGAQAELPAGVPDWPPRPFLARQKVYTKPWQVWLLKQGESVRSDADPRIAEGDCMSNVVLWLDYATITMRLLKAAVQANDFDAVIDLIEQSTSYQAAAYDAARMRVDDISMNLLNKPAADLYIKTSRMNLETATMRAPGIKFLRQSNAAMLTAKAKAIANKAAAVPMTSTDSVKGDGNSKKSKSGRSSQASGQPKKGSSKPTTRPIDNESRPAGAPQTAATSTANQTGRAAAAGGQ